MTVHHCEIPISGLHINHINWIPRVQGKEQTAQNKYLILLLNLPFWNSNSVLSLTDLPFFYNSNNHGNRRHKPVIVMSPIMSKGRTSS